MASVAMDILQRYAPFVAEHLVTVNATTAQNQLYGDVDLGGLNWLERNWAAYYIWMGNPVLATGLLSFLFHEVSPFSTRRHAN
jgi:methylsterol monooxygenase